MRKQGKSLILLLVGTILLLPSLSFAISDGFFQLAEVLPTVWDGTDASRTKAPTADYDYTYGDEASVTYNLPWVFNYYGQAFSQITVDTNGNVWFGSTGSAHSFNLATTERGPVIAAWNNDLSSYYYGGVFIQHKTSPDERVVIEWQAETYTEEGYYRPNNFEVVLYRNGTVRIDYNSFNSTSGRDFGTGISKGDGTASLSLTANYGDAFTLAGRSFQFSGLPKISVTPASYDFGNGYVGAATSPHTFTVTNMGNGALAMGAITLGGTDAGEFTITNNSCAGQSLAPAATCTVQAAFAPTALGAKNAALRISSNDAGTPFNSVLTGTGIYPTLTVTKAGTGAGTVSSSIAGFDCDVACSSSSASVPTNTPVTLTATPVDSSFAGWSGGGCSGTDPCTLTLNASATVTATFNILPPVCDFYASPTGGCAPLSVTFFDLSQRAASWSWSFGDGATSTQQNPDHTYLTPDVYTVTLTVTNASGACTMPKENYISTRPVRIARPTPVYFNTIGEAYAAAADGETIQCQAVALNENLDFNLNKSVILDGGYDPEFTVSSGVTTVHGAMNVTAGTVSAKSFDLGY